VTLTFIGLIQLILGLAIVLWGRLRTAFIFLIVSGLFSGSAAVALPALGGSTIPPVYFALGFVILRIVVPRGGYLGLVPEAISANKWFLLFTFYGVAAAYVGPRLFAEVTQVAPMNALNARGAFDMVPLLPTSQNITAQVYMIGSFMMALCGFILCRREGGKDTLISSAIFVSWAHIVLGLVAIAVRGTPLDAFLELFRNGNYVYMDSVAGGFVRIAGIFPETSLYSAFAFSFFVLHAELWYRSIRPNANGWLAFVLALILFFSTSSTAYMGLLSYLLFFMLRTVMLPHVADQMKMVRVIMAMGAMVIGTAIVLAVNPGLPEMVWDMILVMTVDKSSSESAEVRLIWAMQGVRLLFETWGIGAGPGSFRSSSMITAMMGSVGVIGTIAFFVYLMQVLKPMRRSTWGPWSDDAISVGGAFASAAFLGLVPMVISAPQAYPDWIFSLLAGGAIALRMSPRWEDGAQSAYAIEEPPEYAMLGDNSGRSTA